MEYNNFIRKCDTKLCNRNAFRHYGNYIQRFDSESHIAYTRNEASLQLNGVFQAAENACKQYIENVIRLSQNQQTIIARREKESQENAEKIINDAKKQAEETTAITQKQCAEMLEKAQTESQKCWDAVSAKLASISNEHAELRQLLSQLSMQGEDSK